MKTVIEQYKKMFESRISVGATENCQDWKNLKRKMQRGPTTWRDMFKNASRDTVNWETRKWSNIQRRRIGIKSVLTHCLEMLALVTNWTT